MNKLKIGKGALKDYHRCIADEYDDYAEQPEFYDPIPLFTNPNGSHAKTTSKKPKTSKLSSKMLKFKPDFDFVTASGGVFERHFGEKLAMFLDVSDILKLLRTCRYLYKVFSRFSIWRDFLTNNHGLHFISNDLLSSIDIKQFAKYLRCAKYKKIQKTHHQEKNNDGIVFDTLIMEKRMRKEDRFLVRNIVDSVTARSQKTIDTITKVAMTGTFTEDLKISWIKELNQIVVWMAGYHIETKYYACASDNFSNFACILFNKKYEELVSKVYFLNDRYFVVEIEETNEGGEPIKTLEVYAIEPEHDWFEKKHISLCKQVLKESFAKEKAENIKVRNVGDFVVFVMERENKKLCVQVFDGNNGKYLYQSEDLSLEADFNDVIASRSVDQSSFNLYLLDKESEVYLLNYCLESGATLNKIDAKKTPNEEEKKEELPQEKQNQRFSDTIKKYQNGRYLKIDKEFPSKTIEYLMVHKKKKFYLMNLKNNELVYCDLLGYSANSKLFNWTICGEYLYLLIDTTIQIYQLDFNSCSATLIKKEEITLSFRGSSARWILVSPCFTMIVSASSVDESLMSSLQIFIGSTQDLLIKRMPWNSEWYLDQFRLDNILGKIDKWQDVSALGKETVECRFEDERFLIQTNVREYFRDFSICERRVEKKQYEWKVGSVYDLSEPVEVLTSDEPSSDDKQENSTKKNKTNLVTSIKIQENKNYSGKMKNLQGGNQNWKNIEKKEDTEEKLEKKVNKKKGDKYYKNVRQDKHRGKMSDY